MYFPWLDTNEYPFQSHFFSINGHKLHYIDEGKGKTLLFVHGTPSWSFDFRNVIKALKPHYRCIAIDHIGFGLSDKPYIYDYSTINHSLTLERFIHEKQLSDITLVVHDFGGPIGLSCAMRNPQLFSKIIILNSWLWSTQDDPEFKRFFMYLKSPLIPSLYRYLNFSPRFILPSSFIRNKPDKSILNHYTKPFANSRQREGALAFAYSLLNDQKWFEELWSNRSLISEKPTLFIWGMDDPIIKPHILTKFTDGFINARSVQLKGIGHFPQEEAPEQVGNEIVSFLKE